MMRHRWSFRFLSQMTKFGNVTLTYLWLIIRHFLTSIFEETFSLTVKFQFIFRINGKTKLCFVEIQKQKKEM